MLYIGSCRYMYDFSWDYFPARLHSTREVIFFLENIENLQRVIDSNPASLKNLIFGDMFYPTVANDSKRFMAQPINRSCKKIIIEISSRKVCYYSKTVPISHYYSTRGGGCRISNIEQKILSDEEIETDLLHIESLCRKIFNPDIEIHIIPHLNLKTKSTNNYIPERNDLTTLLEKVCIERHFKIHNVGKYIKSTNSNSDCFLEDFMPDSHHYSRDYDKVKRFIIEQIIE